MLSLPIFFVLLFSNHLSYAETAAQSLHHILAPVNSISATFKQQVMDQNNQVYQQLSGDFKASKPNQLHWNIVSPLAQLIVSDGDNVWLYDPDLEQVVIQNFSDDFKANPLSILLGDLNQLNNDFSVTQLLDNKFSLQPKQGNSLFTEIQLIFEKNILSTILYQDTLGQNTFIALEDVKINPPIDQTTFIFQIPQDVDIINHAR